MHMLASKFNMETTILFSLPFDLGDRGLYAYLAYIKMCVCVLKAVRMFHVIYLSVNKSEPQLRQGVDLLTDGYIHNLLTDGGFMFAVRQLLRLKESALAYFALPCNSFTFMSQGTHDRTVWQPFGCLWFAFVQCGNILGARTVLLIMLAACRSVQYFVENPENSCVRFFPYLEHVMAIKELMPNRTRWWVPQSCFSGTSP